MADATHTWESHETKITDPFTVQNMYEIMADSERGPMIAMHQNSVVTQFALDEYFSQTV